MRNPIAWVPVVALVVLMVILVALTPQEWAPWYRAPAPAREPEHARVTLHPVRQARTERPTMRAPEQLPAPRHARWIESPTDDVTTAYLRRELRTDVETWMRDAGLTDEQRELVLDAIADTTAEWRAAQRAWLEQINPGLHDPSAPEGYANAIKGDYNAPDLYARIAEIAGKDAAQSFEGTIGPQILLLFRADLAER